MLSVVGGLIDRWGPPPHGQEEEAAVAVIALCHGGVSTLAYREKHTHTNNVHTAARDDKKI